MPAIPLGPIGGGLSLHNVTLDDLELRCAVTRSLSVPVKTHGWHASGGGFSVDLDTSPVTASEGPASDLTWRPGDRLAVAGPARLAITGSSCAGLTPVRISRLPLAGTLVPAGSIPQALPPAIEFASHPAAVFGMRTSAGRLARVKAWHDLGAGGALHLDWITCDTPAPKLLPFPIDDQWCLCGTVREDGEGEVGPEGRRLRYKLQGRRLMVQTQALGDAIDCQPCLSAIDGRGQAQFTCIRLHSPATAGRRAAVPHRRSHAPALRPGGAGCRCGPCRTAPGRQRAGRSGPPGLAPGIQAAPAGPWFSAAAACRAAGRSAGRRRVPASACRSACA
jgi:hypothetical protein